MYGRVLTHRKGEGVEARSSGGNDPFSTRVSEEPASLKGVYSSCHPTADKGARSYKPGGK